MAETTLLGFLQSGLDKPPENLLLGQSFVWPQWDLVALHLVPVILFATIPSEVSCSS